MLAALLVAFQEAAPAAAPPRARGWDDFPVFVWREKYAGKPLPEELSEPFGGVILMREEDSTWARERGLGYLVWNVAGRDALHLDADEAWNARVERWIETRDEKLLVREPCLDDPRTVAKLYATLDTTIAKHGEHPGLGFVLGDEVGLTPNGDPFDLCRCGFCDAKWKEHAEENRLPELAPLTDEVRLALLEDDFSTLGTWLARRRFDRARVLELLETLARRVHGAPGTFLRGPDPLLGLPVGLLGIGAATAFGGIDLAGGLPFIDFVECYPALDARELLLTLPERERRSPLGYAVGARPRATVATVFVRDETPESATWKVWEHWLRGGNAVVLWSDLALEQNPPRAARLSTAVARIRALETRFPEVMAPVFARSALVHDSDSIALAWLRDALLDGPTWPRRRAGFQENYGTREARLRTWLRRIEGRAVLPGSVPLARLGELCHGGCRTLILSDLLVLSAEDVAALEHQLDLGTVLIVDGRLGWVDRGGQPWRESVLERLQRKAPAQVRLAPDDCLRASVDVAWTPLYMGKAKELAWLTSVRCTAPVRGPGEGDLLVTALPRAPLPADLGPLRLAIRPPAEYELEWIHPPDGSELHAGDAAVFLLRAAPR